ncbi:hypothetical protein [Rhizobium leguminosarum]|uniref:hypothetical protein n=1 Tax=Rhizobium leguminosarum TaxID=384 RepID=UPI003F97D113
MTAPTRERKPGLGFEAGIGGRVVLREGRVLRPECGFVCVADDVGVPYGGGEE